MATVISNSDTISVDPAPAYSDGAFTITGHAYSPYGVQSILVQGYEDAKPVTLGTTTVDADGAYAFRLPVAGKSYDSVSVSERNTTGTLKVDQNAFSLDGDWSGHPPIVASDDEFTSLGTRTQTFYLRADGSVWEQDTFGDQGSLVTRRVNNDDGSNTITVAQGGATVPTFSRDTIENALEQVNTFVFDPGHGLDVVRQFLGDGTDHDFLSFKGSDFGNSVAEVLYNTHQYKGVGTYIVDPMSGDAVRLTNVSKAELAVNTGDITFHP